MPLDPRVVEARIALRIAELRVIAAKQFCRARLAPADTAASPGVAGVRWHVPPPSARRLQPFRPRSGGGGRS